MKIIIPFYLFLFVSVLAYAQSTVIPYGSAWKYLDNGSDQGTAWTGTSFNDASWSSGNAQLGYGDGDEATVVSYGPNASNKYITTYFRKNISIANASTYTTFTFNVKRDDGIVVYVNGQEVFRDNMPSGTILYTTFSASDATDDGNAVESYTLSLAGSHFVTGSNTVAAEIHQRAVNSSDISFDMEVLASQSTAEIIPNSSLWKYLDNGSDQGTSWTGTSFSDGTWAEGAAELGYGDGDEATVLSYGPSSSNKYATTYFRKSFTITDVNQFDQFTFNYRRDDGLILYVNGNELFRDNMPSGTITYQSYASGTCSDDGNTVQTKTYTLANSFLVSGANTIAAEIHQADGSSSDISFILELLGEKISAGANLTRGPYLQKATSTGITFRWNTDAAVDSKVLYGTDPDHLTETASVSGTRTDHTVSINGLQPFTRYYYSIGTSAGVLQGDQDNYFVTSPVSGTAGKYNFWIIGDCGNNSTNQKNVRDRYLEYIGTDTTHAWLTMGDNAYNSGQDSEFANNFFGIYQGSIMKHAPLWPSPGNHDYANNSSRQNDHDIPYYTIFETPTSGEAGGVASNTEAFYSFDYGNVHFLALDSYGKEDNATRLYDTLGAQVQWIKQDLNTNAQKWTVAYWHHPPYTMGSHNSDTEGELISMRENFIRILERYGVDVILCGHSHDYERSKLMKGHYGNESSFDPETHNLSQSSGMYDGSENSCTYLKDSLHTLDGTVYVVSGSSGPLGGTQASFPHDAMYYSDATHGGALVMNVEGSRMDVKWLCADGQIRDRFTIIKDASKVKDIQINPGETLNLKASWKGEYVWEHSPEQTQMVSVSPTSSTTYIVHDQYECVADTFKVTVLVATENVDQQTQQQTATVYPNPFQNELTLHYYMANAGQVTVEIMDLQGRILATPVNRQYTAAGEQQWTWNVSNTGIKEGMYLIAITDDQHKEMVRVMHSK